MFSNTYFIVRKDGKFYGGIDRQFPNKTIVYKTNDFNRVRTFTSNSEAISVLDEIRKIEEPNNRKDHEWFSVSLYDVNIYIQDTSESTYTKFFKCWSKGTYRKSEPCWSDNLENAYNYQPTMLTQTCPLAGDLIELKKWWGHKRCEAIIYMRKEVSNNIPDSIKGYFIPTRKKPWEMKSESDDSDDDFKSEVDSLREDPSDIVDFFLSNPGAYDKFKKWNYERKNNALAIAAKDFATSVPIDNSPRLSFISGVNWTYSQLLEKNIDLKTLGDYLRNLED